MEYLLEALARVGLAIEVRNGDKSSLLVFVKVASDERLNHEVYRSRLDKTLLSSPVHNLVTVQSRLNDWLQGVRAAQPEEDNSGQDLTQAERYRIVHHLITSPVEDGGAAITPKEGKWKNVESVFPLHDKTFNEEWIKKWSTTTFLKPEDLDDIRDRLGEKVDSCSCYGSNPFAG